MPQSRSRRVSRGDRPPELVNLTQIATSAGLTFWLSGDRDRVPQLT